MPTPAFSSLPFSRSRTVTWIHIGDTHLTAPGEQNDLDLGRIVDEINETYASGGVDFVFLPGDIADDGSVAAYQVFRKHLDRLRLPWIGIVGDHDVHEQHFENFQRYVSHDLFSAFELGPYRFLRLNAFSEPRPDSFVVDHAQLEWLQRELQQAADHHQKCVLFLHCYPSDLKRGGAEITRLLEQFPVLLVDMGHTHYNEISNDGNVLYTATRSTGQIEEGPVGYSLLTLDGDTVSWHFAPLGAPRRLVITTPADRRLRTRRIPETDRGALEVHAKIWPDTRVRDVQVSLEQISSLLTTEDGLLWRGTVDARALPDGRYTLTVTATTEHGPTLNDTIEIQLGPAAEHSFCPVDQDNAIGAWEERGLLGTQLGPNKNGRKW